MLYPAELLRHAVFASRIPIYFTAWGGLCQGLVGLSWLVHTLYFKNGQPTAEARPTPTLC